MSKFEIYRGSDRKNRWRLVAANGEIVCSSQAYKTRKAALDGVAWVRANAAGAGFRSIKPKKKKAV